MGTPRRHAMGGSGAKLNQRFPKAQSLPCDRWEKRMLTERNNKYDS